MAGLSQALPSLGSAGGAVGSTAVGVPPQVGSAVGDSLGTLLQSITGGSTSVPQAQFNNPTGSQSNGIQFTAPTTNPNFLTQIQQLLSANPFGGSTTLG
jgi:hypothetical protein